MFPVSMRRGKRVRKRTVSDLYRAPFPTCSIVPYMKVVHDRLSMEIARGCKRGCRFCEAGFIHRPYRERDPKGIEKTIHDSLERTGYEEVSPPFAERRGLLFDWTSPLQSYGPLRTEACCGFFSIAQGR